MLKRFTNFIIISVAVLTVLLAVIMAVGWQQANILGQQLAEKEVVVANMRTTLQEAWDAPPLIVYKEIEKPFETVIYEMKEVYIDRPVEQVVYKYRDWVVFDRIEDIPVPAIYGFRPDICLDIAKDLQSMLQNQGYVVSVALAWNHYYYGKYVTDAPDGHAGLLVETKEGWYFIDPELWRITKLFQ